MQDGISDHQRGRRICPARRAQALRTGDRGRDSLQQGDRQVAVSAPRTGPLGAFGAGAAGRHDRRRPATDRRRQPGRSAGMDLARIRVRPRVAHRGHRARRRSPAARRGDRRGRSISTAMPFRRIPPATPISRRCARCRACTMPCWSGWCGANKAFCLRPAIRNSCTVWPMFLPRGAQMAVRQPGAGAQMLLEMLLTRAGAGPKDLRRLEPPCLTGPDLAAAIRAGKADCGVATRAAAKSAGLDFVPLLWENFDLLMRQRSYFRPQMQALIGFLGAKAAEAAGRRTHRLRPGARRSDPVRRLMGDRLTSDSVCFTSPIGRGRRKTSGEDLWSLAT